MALRASSSIIYSHTALRGIAAAYVLLFHVFTVPTGPNHNGAADVINLFPNGDLAVDLFFILSGFILHWVYLPNDRNEVNWSSYLKARAARILPLYYLTSAVLLPRIVYNLIVNGRDFFTGSIEIKLILNALLLSGILNGPAGTLNFAAWSISVEYFCYIVAFPLLFLATKPLRQSGYNHLYTVIFLVACITGLHIKYYNVTTNIFDWEWKASYLLRGVLGFSSGFLLCQAYLKNQPGNNHKLLSDSIVWITLGMLIATLLGFAPRSAAICAFPVLVYFSASDQGTAARLFRWAPFQWTGERSYSLYLWHPIVMYLVLRCKSHPLLNQAIAIPVIFVISDLSYRYFESPIRSYLRRRR